MAGPDPSPDLTAPPIDPRALQVHGLTDAMVADLRDHVPTDEAAVRELMTREGGAQRAALDAYWKGRESAA